MTTIQVKVPDIGGFNDVAVIELLVKPGDTVEIDQSLITVESDKALMEIPSGHAGVVKELKVALGDKVSEGSPILLIEAQNEGVAAPASAPAAAQAAAVAIATPAALVKASLPASHPNVYLDFISRALHASGQLRVTVEAQTGALLDVVDVVAARISYVEDQGMGIANKFGFKGLLLGPGDPLIKAQALHDAGISRLNKFWEDGVCDLEALSLSQLPGNWQKMIEDHVVVSLQMIRDIKHSLELFPKGWEHRLQQIKIKLVSHDTLEAARTYQEAEHLLFMRVADWEALKGQGSIALFDLHAFATHADTQVVQEKIVAAQAEQEKLCAKVVQQRRQAKGDQKREEQRKRDEALRLEENRRLKIKLMVILLGVIVLTLLFEL